MTLARKLGGAHRKRDIVDGVRGNGSVGRLHSVVAPGRGTADFGGPSVPDFKRLTDSMWQPGSGCETKGLPVENGRKFAVSGRWLRPDLRVRPSQLTGKPDRVRVVHDCPKQQYGLSGVLVGPDVNHGATDGALSLLGLVRIWPASIFRMGSRSGWRLHRGGGS